MQHFASSLYNKLSLLLIDITELNYFPNFILGKTLHISEVYKCVSCGTKAITHFNELLQWKQSKKPTDFQSMSTVTL